MLIKVKHNSHTRLVNYKAKIYLNTQVDKSEYKQLKTLSTHSPLNQFSLNYLIKD